MERFLRYFFGLLCALMSSDCFAAAVGRASKYIDPQSYAYMYPYLSNKMRTELNPGTTVSMANNPMNVVVKTEQMSAPRRVVSRASKTSGTTVGRAATTTQNASTVAAAPTRRVVARPQTQSARVATAQTARAAVQPVARASAAPVTNTTNEGVSYARCIADYTTCMDGYCAREQMAYNRCYCSAKLAQIDAQYQNNINNLITQIIQIQSGNNTTWTNEEMNEYWMQTVGGYVGTNSWANLENALNIEWPTADERLRGQQVFLTGHQYCAQHLRGCAPVASNMRDAYRSRIARDCQTYENALMKIQTAAEAFIENYRE